MSKEQKMSKAQKNVQERKMSKDFKIVQGRKMAKSGQSPTFFEMSKVSKDFEASLGSC